MKIREYALATGRSVENAEIEAFSERRENRTDGGAYMYRTYTTRIEKRRSSHTDGCFGKQDAEFAQESVVVYVGRDRKVITNYRDKRKRAARGTYEYIAPLKGYGLTQEIRRRKRAREIKKAVFEGIVCGTFALLVMGCAWLVAIGIDRIFILMGVA